ncbi:flagellin N-terminal-like domain-containing protein [Haloarchaeobius iranensis]|uniref:Flagellin N-terminal-like domain-containing protein n=1 Tax=Haloarchaeobius iranensis TaxID=996166 RepID=A0A1G9SCY4_9EURY|nr:flagellin N-terminal-like domain-containing protein [Haloarchaeobius iranensis]
MRRGTGGDGGQSAPVGTLLMVALVLVAAGAAGVVIFDLSPDLLGNAPSASIDVGVESNGPNAQTLVISHQGGDDLRIDEFDVVVRDGGSSSRLSLSSFRNRSGVSDGVADAGDSLRATQLLSGPVTVQLIHRPTDSVVSRQRVTLPSDDATSVVDFESSAPTQSFESNQDGSGSTTVEDGGATVRQSGNQWKYVERNYTVTENTTLVFEFNSTSRGEIHGIGLEDDQQQTGGRIVEVYGAQGWGHNVTNFDGLERYQAGDGWARYEVPIGEHYTSNGFNASTRYLVFITDCDGNVDPSSTNCPSNIDDEKPANSRFRNVRIYENDSTASLASPVVGSSYTRWTRSAAALSARSSTASSSIVSTSRSRMSTAPSQSVWRTSLPVTA